MPLLLTVFTLLVFLQIPPSSATKDNILAGQALAINDKLVSSQGRYALGFFKPRGRKSSQGTTNWYLGIWFNTVPKFTSAWVANRDKPIKNTTSLELTISHDGNLVILNRYTNSIIWSTQANTRRNSTTAVLLDSGNLILANSSNSSEVLWQSFDHPTDTLLPFAKLGWDKVAGLNRRLVSWKSMTDPGTGVYCDELDPRGDDQVFLKPLNSTIPYWSAGIWKYFPSLLEMEPFLHRKKVIVSFVNMDHEKYFIIRIDDDNMIIRHVLDVSGQAKTLFWSEGLQDWTLVSARPKDQCVVYAVCGPFTICTDNMVPHCNCMEGFTITSPKDWELEDRTGGCSRNTPLYCVSNKSISHTTDKFYPVPCVMLPQNVPEAEAAANSSDCAQVCLNSCSCTAYSFSDGRCSIMHNELLNIRQLTCSGSTNSTEETIYIRLSSKEFNILRKNRKEFFIGVATGISAIGLFALIILVMIWKNKRKNYGVQGCNGITAFGYTDLQHATNKFKHKLGGGSFGSVFKGLIDGSTAIAVKKLENAYQGEKQFRAEVSSIGAIHHINLVKLVGFCCEGSKRLLVYELMSNRSLDVHLFQINSKMLNWTARYQIALGVARGLAYLHSSCRDCIIHCDIKPENILLDASFIPKIADFGMSKILGRNFSRVLTTMRGTAGYLAPEWIAGVAITSKVDVYSYGMVLLEIISRRRNSCAPCSSSGNLGVYFPVHAAHKLLEGKVESLVDQMLHGDVNLDEAELACKVACWCIQDNEFDRPTMGEVVHILEGQVKIGMPPIPKLLQAMSGSSHSTHPNLFV
jgi:hypothetical protein